MQQPKMIVLGLITQGMNYGLEMEKHVEATNMRLWAQIGTSTIYKALRDLEAEECVTARPGIAKRGPGKTVYEITNKGKKTLDHLVGEALTSHESVYSDRIAGLVFALSLPKAKAREKVAHCVEGLNHALETLADERQRRDIRSAQIVIDYYRDVYEAERRALIAVQENILNKGSKEK